MILNKLTKKLALLALLITAQVSLPGINLRLNQKPKHISTHDWCTQRAREFVSEKRRDVLKILGIHSKHRWEPTKNILRQTYHDILFKEIPDTKPTKPFPEYIKKPVLNVIEHHYVQKVFGITAIKEVKNQIIAERNNGLHLVFEIDRDPAPKSTATTDGYTVMIAPEFLEINQDGINKLEAVLCHELGHVLREHSLEFFCLRRTYEQLLIEGKILATRENEFKKALRDLDKAMETEADIVAGFKNWKWTKDLASYFNEHHLLAIAAEINGLGKIKDPKRHPPTGERAEYLTQMYQSIQKDAEPTPKPRPKQKSKPKPRPKPKLRPIQTEKQKQKPRPTQRPKPIQTEKQKQKPRPTQRQKPKPKQTQKQKSKAKEPSNPHPDNNTQKQQKTKQEPTEMSEQNSPKKDITNFPKKPSFTEPSLTKPSFTAKYFSWCTKIFANTVTKKRLLWVGGIITSLYALGKIIEISEQ